MQQWQRLFQIAALFNFVVGLQFLFLPGMALSNVGLPVPEDMTYHRLVGILVFFFGLIYGLVARDVARFRPLITIAFFGKTAVFLLFTWAYIQGQSTLPAYMLSWGDLTFTFLFGYFLLKTRDQAG